YGERLHANTAELLRQSLTDEPGEFGESLQRMFTGHDDLTDSPEGQAFQGFSRMLALPDQRSRLESDIDEILARVSGLPQHLRDMLETFLDTVSQRVHEVETIQSTAFRRMSNFFRAGDIAHFRSMRDRVETAQRNAVDAF